MKKNIETMSIDDLEVVNGKLVPKLKVPQA